MERGKGGGGDNEFLALVFLFRKVREGGGLAAEAGNESSIVRDFAEESADIPQSLRLGPFFDDLGVAVGDGDASGRDVVSQVLDPVLEELTFLWLKSQTGTAMGQENSSEPLDVGGHVHAVNAGVIQVGDGDGQRNSSEDFLDQAAVGGGGIAEAEGHLLELKEAPWGRERSFLSILATNGHDVVGASAVDAREDLAVGEPGEVVLDVGQGEGILQSDLVEATVVDAVPPRSVLLRDDHQRETPGRGGGLDDVLVEPMVQLLPEPGLQRRVQWAVSTLDGRNVLGMDGVLHLVGLAVLVVVAEEVVEFL